VPPSPQLENGFTRIANELLEALIKTKIPGEEIRIIWAIIRKTYGFGKKTDRITLGQLESQTGIPKKRVHRLIGSLVAKNMIVKKKGRTGPVYGINKRYKAWASTIPHLGDTPKRQKKGI